METWSDVWSVVGPQTDAVLTEGRSTWNDRTLLLMERNGFIEEAYFTYSYSPVSDDDGNVVALFCAVTEETRRVLGERRLGCLKELVEATGGASSESEVSENAASCFAHHGLDIAFALVYRFDEAGTARLDGAAGLIPGSRWAPIEILSGAHDPAWPLRNRFAPGPILLEDLADRQLPGGQWPEAAKAAMVLPLNIDGEGTPAGYLVIGASPRLDFDVEYRGFFLLVADSLAAALSRARSNRELHALNAELLAHVEQRTRELAQERAFLGAVLESAAEGIVACDADGVLRLFNRTSREFHSMSAEQVPTGEWPKRYSLYYSDGKTPLLPEDVPLARALQEGRVAGAEIVIAPDGLPQINVSCDGSALYDDEGNLLGAVVVMRDIRERLALEHANRELQGFTHSIAHDLRAPLRAIVGKVAMTREDYSESMPTELLRNLDSIEGSALTLGRLVDDLLEFSRLGRREAAREPVDLSAVACAVVQNLPEDLTERGRVTVEPNMNAVGDPQLIAIVLENLIGNALKYSQAGQVNIVEVGQRLHESGPVFYVSDRGIGFPAEQAERIFLPFERLHRKADYPGSGIGLANVRRIIEKHRGKVWAESQEGLGARFFFTLR